jgi:hypothetical protein
MMKNMDDLNEAVAWLVQLCAAVNDISSTIVPFVPETFVTSKYSASEKNP